MFTPRLDAPSSSDKLWIQKYSGGYNPCIPIYGGPSVLPNCFTGDTRIITRQGTVRLDSIVDQDIDALSEGEVYRPAKGVYCGKQHIYRITFMNGKSYNCTADHRWVVQNRNSEYSIKTTLELTSHDHIPYVPIPDEEISSHDNERYTRVQSIEDLGIEADVFCIQEPETHTMVLEGGILTGQCVGYSWGRFTEILGATSCNLSTDNAGLWYGNTQDGYERGSEPRLGAVICWRRPGAAGHVAIVEQINADGSIVTSNSAYNSTRFYTQTLQPPAYTWSSQYILQGFIYNPMAPTTNSGKIEGFIKVVKDSIGESASIFSKKSREELSGSYVIYCANKIPDLIGNVFPNTVLPSSFCKTGVAIGAGTFIEGPILGKQPAPEVGDIALIRKDLNKKYKNNMDCDILCVVTDAGTTTFTSVGVADNKKIKQSKHGVGNKYILGYYRPKWEKFNNSTTQMIGYSSLGKYYDTENTEQDATIREVGYLSTKFEPTTSKSDIKLSMINYTTLLSAFMDDLLVPSVISGNISTDTNIDGITDPNAKVVINYLISKGLNAAASCGVAGNIYHESRFNAGAMGDYEGRTPTSFGICQWHYGRGAAMKTMAGSNWQNNLTGQLDYLWHELQTSYKGVLSVLMSVPNNDTGVRKAADTFVRKFEVPASIDSESAKRQATAIELWNKISVQMTTTTSGSSSVVSGMALTGTTISIPTWVVQDGLSNIYTNYSYFYSRWAKSSYQRKVADLWASRGRKSNRNIATLDGYYLIATKPKFGKCGDKVSVILKDGTIINAILADIKGAENGTGGAADYGHNSNGKINIIEWEGVGGTNSVYLPKPIDLTGWQGKAVDRIINGGSIL